MGKVGRGQHRLSGSQHRVGLTVMHHGRGQQAQAAVVMLVVLLVDELAAELQAVFDLVKRSGNSGRYLSVLNWLSEKGLSLETCGRLCDLVIPSVAKS